MRDSLWTPTVTDVLAIHEDIVSEYDATEPGVRDEGAISFAIDRVVAGSPTNDRETIDEKAFELLRLLVANHPFVDANKRTALDTVATFYLLNGYRLEYDSEIRRILSDLAIDESAVDRNEVIEYLRTHTRSIDTDETLRGIRSDLVEYGLTRYRDEEK
ncbi:type II toxin-antitoxin system death-on-curing family toxin [Halalkalicoccus sp. NIPERK01]|uniref:type II toxin-antitoxin system death-on-curing family toxin n=1 Tax=Halalkalicoccus sp. NIPERK01 TaxID=3053469 RepID=UPI00256F5D03|nr:type II toxin-antitoxin system death-on-curing family toxin [Halalkalicoccus sp. NIPERK01]MDL5361715.1 type II toxin-antitoxin system death-on-curing family toxin [Halalkalicoccus sp. NIPERK01]